MAEGRASGNTDNDNYLLQDYSTSIEYFDKLLTIATESNDQEGQRCARTNLANAYLYSGDFDRALHHYREAMMLSETMNDELSIAQSSFMLGRVYNIKQDYATSIFFHEKHLNLAHKFQDYKAQCQAYFILSQLYEKIQQYDKAKKYQNLYESLSGEINETNEKKPPSKSSLLKSLRAESISVSLSESHIANATRSNSVVSNNLINSTDEKSIINTNKRNKLSFIQHFTKKSPIGIRKKSLKADPEELVDLVCRMQNTRFDDQRCDIKTANDQSDKNTSVEHNSNSHLEDIFKVVDRLQQSRLDDQRTDFPNPTNSRNATAKMTRLLSVNEQFLDQLAKCQDARMDDQRAVLLPLSNSNNKLSTARPISPVPIIKASDIKQSKNQSTSKTLPDEDFFSALNRLQATRADPLHTDIPSKRKLPLKKP
ncbi:unnamed protein product [Rotaria magnacalcarata]|uniref:Uncharacterized protein n=1 Tax=Rotaria magnacalcarata TaxID=392030 RepID=A0A814I330_9BILA|nr:unnamed protein product [Rotaria magnacalcarata]CAF1625904.1 unnamed protein product [Rotaria magnacalcarata]CAF2065910.1 unnamed protein product [Rotaria magnacalcarata]CAF3975116.1 unnamed protein product [Rotaria magnacalcarata]CAF4018118.1 unnamed protein product [Rotaria magnacalcarata]